MPDQIWIRGRIYERYAIRGRVVAGHPSGTSGPMAPGRLRLWDRRGRTHWLPRESGGAKTVAGHELTAVWLVRHDRGSGPYVAVRNHATAETWHNDRALARLHRPTWLLCLGVVAAVLAGPNPAGWFLAAAGGVGWWVVGIAGGRLLKASGALLPGAESAVGQGISEPPSSTMGRGTA